MTVVSKLIGAAGGYTGTYNCYEMTHPWTPSCNRVVVDMFMSGIRFSLKTYLPLYLKLSTVDWRRFVIELARSVLSLATNSAGMWFLICQMRRFMGVWASVNCGPMNGFVSSLVAILIENPRRRPMLALYLTNLASEVVYRMLHHRGYVPMIAHAQIYMFCVAIGGFAWLSGSNRLEDKTDKFIDFMLARSSPPAEIIKSVWLKRVPILRNALDLFRSRTEGMKHSECMHRHSCVANATECFLRNFSIIYAGSALIYLISSYKRIVSSPTGFISGLFGRKTTSFALFTGLLPTLYQTSLCLLHHHTNTSTPWTHAFAGCMAGLSLATFPNTSIAMYALWKFLDSLYSAYDLPRFKYADILMYSVSTAICLTAMIIEPHAIRRSYLNFMRALTDNRLDLVHRKCLDQYGWDASKLYGNYTPTLDPRYTTWNPVFFPH